jgi:hypothetical protein
MGLVEVAMKSCSLVARSIPIIFKSSIVIWFPDGIGRAIAQYFSALSEVNEISTGVIIASMKSAMAI